MNLTEKIASVVGVEKLATGELEKLVVAREKVASAYPHDTIEFADAVKHVAGQWYIKQAQYRIIQNGLAALTVLGK